MNPRSLSRRWALEGLVGSLLLLLMVCAAPPVAAQETSDQGVTEVSLEEVNDSGVTGTAELSANGDQTDVAIRLTGATGNYPNHIHEGFCATVDPVPLLPLTHINVGEADPDGWILSTVDFPLDELLAGEYSILVHLSDDQLNEYLACGNIGAPNDVPAVPAALSPSTPTAAVAAATHSADDSAGAVGGNDAAVTEMAATGVGSGMQPDLRLALVVSILAVLSAVIAVGSARRIRPR